MKDYIRALYEMALMARTGPNKPPCKLSSWLVGIGGIRNTHGEVTAIMGDVRSRPGLVNNKSGMYLDQAAQAAWEAGYIVSIDRPCISDFLDALDTCLNVKPVYSADDFEAVEYFEACDHARNHLDALGILAPDRHKAIRVETALATYAGVTLQ